MELRINTFENVEQVVYDQVISLFDYTSADGEPFRKELMADQGLLNKHYVGILTRMAAYDESLERFSLLMSHLTQRLQKAKDDLEVNGKDVSSIVLVAQFM